MPAGCGSTVLVLLSADLLGGQVNATRLVEGCGQPLYFMYKLLFNQVKRILRVISKSLCACLRVCQHTLA